MSEEIEVKKERKPRKVEVQIIRKCSIVEGEMLQPGQVVKMERDLANKFLENGVVKIIL